MPLRSLSQELVKGRFFGSFLLKKGTNTTFYSVSSVNYQIQELPMHEDEKYLFVEIILSHFQKPIIYFFYILHDV